jgi:hypothetical protein
MIGQRNVILVDAAICDFEVSRRTIGGRRQCDPEMVEDMKRLAVRVPADLWRSIAWYGNTAGHTRPDGRVDVSETVRDLITRGLVQDRSAEAGYRSGHAAGRSAAYRDHMRQIAAATAASPRRK